LQANSLQLNVFPSDITGVTGTIGASDFTA
jgi:hypothetical protein